MLAPAPSGLQSASAVLIAAPNTASSPACPPAPAHLFPFLPSPLPPLQKKGWGCRKEDLNELRAFKRRILSYPSCSELLFDEFLRPGLLIKD